jgi:hypothetical protein
MDKRIIVLAKLFATRFYPFKLDRNFANYIARLLIYGLKREEYLIDRKQKIKYNKL